MTVFDCDDMSQARRFTSPRCPHIMFRALECIRGSKHVSHAINGEPILGESDVEGSGMRHPSHDRAMRCFCSTSMFGGELHDIMYEV